ncbi:uncharacterized protein DUF4388 [Geothermobacter ehrlichii]|uniref:Uncharacterized protein DUF4388 n=1 Tax=Geothermobacter ehrlichii TaxID=213224 RepID=A0A5D3WH58_9BACT|nr:DUF4388 domain-containing protein [Geothermobacter ehrlichii]TYO96303.1 uncharacterized protein DUF4388 [Geothermobacter ehrlichii]
MSGLTVSSHGRINLPASAVRQLRNRTLEVASCSGGHLLLTVRGEDNVCLAGTLGEITLPDLLSFFNMFRKTGILRFALLGGEKALYFREGEVVSATSTFPEEDLGEILFTLGKVDRETLDRARQFATSKSPIGKILVERQVVTAKDLWQALRCQVETIVYDLFTFSEGSFSFAARSFDEEQIVTLAMNTQNLIMEGLRRIDERGLFMEVIGSLDHCPVATGEGGGELSPAEQRLLERIGQGAAAEAREILRQSGLGEFDGLKVLFQLIEKKRVRMERPPQVEVEGRTGELIRIYNAALVAIHARVIRYSPRFAFEVQHFLRDLPPPYSYVFKDVTLRQDGSLDAGRLAANLAGLGEDDRDRLLAEALNELLYMETMVARRDLPGEDSAELVSRVQEIARRVRELVGRNG